MFKKTRVRQIIELLQKDLSNSRISEIRGIIRMCEQVAASGNILILYSA